MSHPVQHQWRAPRAAAFGAAAVALGAVGHLAAGGRTPSLLILAALAFPVALTSLVLKSAPRGRIAVPATLGVVQVYLHHGFMLFSPARALHCNGSTPPAGSDHHGAHALASMPDCGSSLLAAAPGHAPDLVMVAMHLLATVVTAWALTHGDAWLAQVLVRALHGPVLSTCIDVPVRQAPAAALRRQAPRLVVIVGGVGRRGPPLALATR